MAEEDKEWNDVITLVGVHCFHIFDGEHFEQVIVVSFKVRDSFFVKGFKGSTKSNGSVFSAEKRSGDSWQAPTFKIRSVTGDECT